MPRYLRLEDRIRSLSEKLVEAEGKEFQRLAIELRTATSEYIERFGEPNAGGELEVSSPFGETETKPE